MINEIMGHFIRHQLPVDGVDGLKKYLETADTSARAGNPIELNMSAGVGGAWTEINMQTLQQFRSAVRENGFIEVGESHDGSAAWFRKAMPDANTSVHKRLCIDSLTNSATVFWETAPTQMHSKTNVKSLEDWFAVRPAEHTASVTIAKYLGRVV